MTTKTTVELKPAIAPEFIEAMAQHLEQALIDWLGQTGNEDALTAFHGVTNLRYYLDAYKDGTLNEWDEASTAGALPELTKAMAALGQPWRTPGGTVEPGSIKPRQSGKKIGKNLVLKSSSGEPVDQSGVRRMIAANCA